MTDEKQTGLAVEKTGAFKRGFDAVPELIVTDVKNEKAIIEAESEEKDENKDKKKSSVETDTETLQTTDPQEKMEGPISSIMQTIKEVGESNDVISKEEASKKKDENT